MRHHADLIGALALLLAMGCHTDVGEALELATSGGESSEEELRPIRGGTRALIIALDGVGRGSLDGALAAGRLPSLERVFGGPLDGDAHVREHAYLAEGVATTLPSTTMAAWATLFTGSTPAEHGVMGNEWFDRTSASYFAPGAVSVSGSTHTIQIYTEDLIGSQLGGTTVFERLDLRAHVSLGQIHRGADVLTYPDTDVAQVMGVFAEGIFSPHGVMGEAYIELDESSIDPLLRAIETHGLPDVQVVYFPGVDLITHSSVPPMDVQQGHLETVIEPALARVLDAYREADALEQTFVFVIADHGHTSVEAERALAAGPDDAVPQALSAAGFVTRPPNLVVEGTGFSAALAYQGGLANVYLADRSRCERDAEDVLQACDWSAPPRFDEDVRAAAAAFYSSARGGEPVAALEGAIDLVLVREPAASGEEQNAFGVFTDEGVVEVAAYLREHPRPDWVDFEARLRDLTIGPLGHRAGDILLLSRLSPTVPLPERTYFSGAYHSWHGSPTELDSHVPFVVAHPRYSGSALRQVVERALRSRRSTLAFAPLLEALLAE